MKKEHVIVVGVIILLALGMALLGPKDNQPRDGMRRISEALLARKVPVVVVTEGEGGANGEFVCSVKAAVSGTQGTRFIHIDTLNPVERESAARFPKARLPLVTVVGLDGKPAYDGTAPVDAEAIKKAIAEGLTRKPVEIPVQPAEGEGHQH